MEKEQVISALSDFLRDTLRKKDLQINPDDNLIEKLGLDSMGAVEFVIKLEEEFGISIDDNEAQRIQTLNRAAEIVLEKSASKQSGLRRNLAAM